MELVATSSVKIVDDRQPTFRTAVFSRAHSWRYVDAVTHVALKRRGVKGVVTPADDLHLRKSDAFRLFGRAVHRLEVGAATRTWRQVRGEDHELCRPAGAGGRRCIH